MKPKIVITAAANNFHFIKDLVPALSDDFDIRMLEWKQSNSFADMKAQVDAVENADLLWLEWADGANIPLLFSNLELPKIILRLHRYEVFSQRTLNELAKLTQAEKEKITKLVFVSEKVKEIATMHFPWMCEGVVIPNLIDHTRFPLFEKPKGYNILMLGRMSYVKNLPLALTMFHELIKLDRNYQLHIVGEISDPELKYYTANFMEKTDIDRNVYLHGRIPNEQLPEFMKGMHFILSSSIFESFGMGILEAMSCGLKPVIFDFPGAEYMFPNKWRWTERGKFSRIIMQPEYDPREYHDWVYFQFSIEKQIHRYKNFIYEALDSGLTQTEGYMKVLRGTYSK